MRKVNNNPESAYCPHLIEEADNNTPLCRLKHLKPVLNPYEVDLYCKSKSFNTCPYIQHCSKSASKTMKEPCKLIDCWICFHI